MNKLKFYIAVFLFLFLNININAQTVIRGPYLQMVTTNSIYIQWRTSSSTNSRVWYGSAPNNLSQMLSSGTNVTNHSMQITGLTPNTTYYYAVGNSNGQMEGGDADHYFITSPPSNTNQTIRAWVLGNAGNDIDDQTDVRDAFYNYIGNNHIDMMLLLGDNAYLEGTDNQYQEHWFENMYEDRLINSVMWSTYGNRDALSAESETQSGPYYDIFNFPKNAQAGGVSSGTESYYSFDYGNIHFISLDSEDDDFIEEEDGPMYEWLIDDLNSTDKEWKVVIFHHPPYTGTGNNESDSHPNETIMREDILPILEAAGVDLVFGSHHHSYQRSHLINGHYNDSNTFNENTMGIDMGDGKIDGDGAYTKEIDAEGTVYIVAGSAGSVASDPCCYPAMYASLQQLGSVAIEVTDLQMDVKFVNGSGNITDYFTIIKTAGGTPPAVTITNPVNNAFYPAPETIVIAANATDNDGNITHVDFYVDDVFIGSDNTYPYTKSWTIPSNGNYDIKAIAFDNDNLSATSTVVVIQVGVVTVSSQVNAGNNDAEESAAGAMDLTSSDLELVFDGSNQKVGLRFTNLNIPQGADINAAYIQFTCDETNSGTCNLNIFGQAIDNAPVFTTAGSNISNRTKTNTSASWSPANWLTVGEAGAPQKTVDISAVLQEVVSRPGFSSSSAIAIIIEGTGERTAESYEGSPSQAPVLFIEYSLGGPLPIELLDFNAQTIGKEIKLSWSTATEINNDFFTLERSSDGRAFMEIATIPGSGTTTEIMKYVHFDKNPEIGINYYRLKQTDFDGTFSYSPIINDKINDDKHFKVYPSIIKDMITIEKGTDHNEELNIVVHDLLGRKYQTFIFPAGERKMELSLTHLAQGTYFLSLNDDKTKESFIFIKL